jgi:hypothetical protein
VRLWRPRSGLRQAWRQRRRRSRGVARLAAPSSAARTAPHRNGRWLHHERPLEALLGWQLDEPAAHDRGLREHGRGQRQREPGLLLPRGARTTIVKTSIQGHKRLKRVRRVRRGPGSRGGRPALLLPRPCPMAEAPAPGDGLHRAHTLISMVRESIRSWFVRNWESFPAILAAICYVAPNRKVYVILKHKGWTVLSGRGARPKCIGGAWSTPPTPAPAVTIAEPGLSRRCPHVFAATTQHAPSAITTRHMVCPVGGSLAGLYTMGSASHTRTQRGAARPASHARSREARRRCRRQDGHRS